MKKVEAFNQLATTFIQYGSETVANGAVGATNMRLYNCKNIAFYITAFTGSPDVRIQVSPDGTTWYQSTFSTTLSTSNVTNTVIAANIGVILTVAHPYFRLQNASAGASSVTFSMFGNG